LNYQFRTGVTHRNDFSDLTICKRFARLPQLQRISLGDALQRGRGVQKFGVAALCLDAAGDLRLANTSVPRRSIMRGQLVAGAPG